MPSDPFQIVVLCIAFVAGSGMIERDLWPYIFYYVVAPAISGMIGIKLLEAVPMLDMNFGMDRYVDYVMSQKIGLAKAIAIGFGTGFFGKLVLEYFTEPKKKKVRPKRRMSLFGDNVTMVRRRHLKNLGLTDSAGPRDMFLAWTKLSSELQSNKWQAILKERGLDCSEAEFKEWIDESYQWLRSNSDAPVSVAKKRVAAAPETPVKKMQKRTLNLSRQPKAKIRGL